MNNAKAKRKLWNILRRVAIDPDAVTLHEWMKAHMASIAIGRRDRRRIGIVGLGEIRFANGMRLPIGAGVVYVSGVQYGGIEP